MERDMPSAIKPFPDTGSFEMKKGDRHNLGQNVPAYRRYAGDRVRGLQDVEQTCGRIQCRNL